MQDNPSSLNLTNQKTPAPISSQSVQPNNLAPQPNLISESNSVSTPTTPPNPSPNQANVPTQPPATPTTVLPQTGQLDLKTDNIKTEMRRDYIHDYYVLVAPKRRNRPFDTSSRDHPLVETADSPRLDLQESVYELAGPDGDWLVKVVNNKFPALSPDNPIAFGIQELVIDTPIANLDFGEMPVEQIANVLLVYQQRSRALKATEHIKYVSIFRNEGYKAGASLAHAHSQIIAVPMIPPKLNQESKTVEEYFNKHSKDPYDMILEFEKSDGKRIISENSDWLCFAPYAPQWQMEAWILPKRAITAIEDLSLDEVSSLAVPLQLLSKALHGAEINYNLCVEQGISTHQRLAFKVRGRNVISPRGGFEVTTDIIINAIPSEAAADWYRRQSPN